MNPVDPAGIDTPIGYVDLERVRANAQRVADYAAQHGIAWRPHIKTHKSLEVARIQLEAGARGLTVATLREAEVMATLTNDLLLAYPPVGDAKLERLVRLPMSLDLKVALDSSDVLDSVAAASAAADRVTGILVAQDGVEFVGLMFYPGHIRVQKDEQTEALALVFEQLTDTYAALESAGFTAGIVSGGSTPTLWQSHAFPGLTEIRSGSCIFFDREGLALGVASHDDLAYTVLATVVSTAVPGHAVVDSGSKALAKESRGDGGFGVLFDHPGVLLESLSEEHGVLDLSRTDWRPVIGERVRIVPNHVCVSVNLQEALLAKDRDAHSMLTLEGRGRGPWTG